PRVEHRDVPGRRGKEPEAEFAAVAGDWNRRGEPAVYRLQLCISERATAERDCACSAGPWGDGDDGDGVRSGGCEADGRGDPSVDVRMCERDGAGRGTCVLRD